MTNTTSETTAILTFDPISAARATRVNRALKAVESSAYCNAGTVADGRDRDARWSTGYISVDADVTESKRAELVKIFAATK